MSEAKAILPQTLKELLEYNHKVFEETGHYWGIRELSLKNQNPLAYESFHARLLSAVITARETSKRISASPGVREVGESVVALYTPEGDSIVLSTGIVVHVHTMSRFIKWMIQHDYESDPGIRPGDIFANNDPFVSDVHPPDLMTVIPVFWEDELIGWVGAVSHEIEVGGVVGGGNMGTTAERFGNGLTVTAERIGQNDTIRRDYWMRAEYNLRTPIYWILDQKAMLSACLDVRDKVYETIREYGLDYFKEATREIIEEGRQGHMARMKLMTVPGRYRVPAFSAHLMQGKPGTSPLAHDVYLHAPLEMRINRQGRMTLDLDGIGPQSWTPFNCSLTASDGLFFVSLTQFMDYDGRVNDGVWYAVDFNIPKGSWAYPDNHLVSTGGIWSVMMPVFGSWMRAMSRAFLARGFKEEVFVGQVASPIVEGGGVNQYGQRSGAQNLECAAEGSGARAIMDGIDSSYVGWNPESDMGNVEIWEQTLPILYLGRRIVADHYGWGKYRGGTTQSSIYMFHRTPVWLVMSTIHSDLVFDNAGMCGGYPAPTAKYSHTVRGANVLERAKQLLPLPHTEGNPENPEVTMLDGAFETELGFYHNPLTEGDVFQFFYNSGGGYGDPLERDITLIQQDLDNGVLTERMAYAVYRAVTQFDAVQDRWLVDDVATQEARQQARRERIQKALPVAQWKDREYQRVQAKDFAPLVLQMFRDTFRMSTQWANEYRDFWGLSNDFVF